MEDNGYRLSYPGKAPEGEVLGGPPATPLVPVRAHGGPFARQAEGGGRGWANMLIQGDNLGVLRTLLDMKGRGELACADGTAGARVVYIDPPFSTNLTFRTKGRHRAFDDKVTGAEFLEFLRRRLILIRELLAADGSVFVHLDWKMAHSAKVLMDEVFGADNFLNDIVWHYGGRGAKATSNQFSRNHDNILWYRRSGRCVFNRVYTERKIRKGAGGFRQDARGRWFKTSPRGDYTDASIAALEEEGRVHRTRNGKIRIKYFLREKGDYLIEDRLVGDVWDDIPDAMHLPRSERTGYPTQKPEGLLRRVVRAASNEGDLVLDAFCGAGTTAVAAERLGRRWVAVDSAPLAVHTTEKRLASIGAPAPFALYTDAPEGETGAGEGRAADVRVERRDGEYVIGVDAGADPEISSVVVTTGAEVPEVRAFFHGDVLARGAAFPAAWCEDAGGVRVVCADALGGERRLAVPAAAGPAPGPGAWREKD